MTTRETISLFLRLLTQNPSSDFEEIAARLRSAGISEVDSELLIAFVPMAFAHAILEPMGVVLPRTFVAAGAETDDRERAALDEEPVFVSASEMCKELLYTHPDRARRVASLSAEWVAVEDLFSSERGVRGIVLTEPLLCRISPSIVRRRKNALPVRAKQWWKFL